MNNNINQQLQILLNQFNVQNFQHVITKSKLLIKKNPENIILYNLLGSSLQKVGDFINAENVFLEGLKIDNNNLAINNNLAMNYRNLLRYKKSENCFLEIIKKNKNYINAYVNLGNLKRDLNNFNEAIELYNQALKIDKENSIVYYSLALAYQGLGKFDDAISFANKALNINPNFTRAENLISQSSKYNSENDHYKRLKNKVNNKDLTNTDKIELYFAIAKADEDLGNIKEASENLIIANNLKKKLTNYKFEKDLELFEDIKKIFNNIQINLKEEENKDDLIFILGMPRSGTSLVEQIISSHSNVFGAGELPILSSIIKENFINEDKLSIKNFNEIINNKSKLMNLRNDYREFINNFHFKEKFITDKAPLNFRWIGFIKILFPNAKIIHCTRDSKNNCLSMYKNLFEGGLNFTYDQIDLVKYYKQYQSLMNFWQSLFKDWILEVKYENLINNNSSEIKKIINYCELSWEEKCLSFHKNTTPIKTMSTAQARKPIYKSSINAFDKFKKFFIHLDNNL